MRRLSRAATAVVLAAVSVTTIYPLVFMVLTALKSRKEYILNQYGLPHSPTLENFFNAWVYAKVGRYAVNSVIVVIAATLLSLIICSLAGYAFSHLEFRGRRALFLAVLGSMAVAEQVVLIPLYTTMVRLGLHNRHAGLILVYTTLSIPFGAYLLTSYFKSIPRSLTEAAQVDGASPFQSLRMVILPIARPALVTLGIFNFLWMWNELLFSLLILQDDRLRTLMVGVANLRGQYTTNIPLLSAGLFLSALPVLLVFLFLQAHLTKGMTMGAVKA
jgi:ABC-type glycerol-3-phosphate transport system permease component